MFSRVRLFFVFLAIFLVSCFLIFVFALGLFRQLPRDSNAESGMIGKNDVVTFLDNFANACESARIEGKPLIVFFTLSDNESCKRSFELFRNNEIRRLSQHFICVSVDGILSGAICELYRVNGFPTVLILDSEGKEIQRLTGKETKEQLSIQMHIAIQLSSNADKNKIR
ncbi:MAG: thioredoxin family protein [Planctomycetaceae bacterium]|jgi:thioredoxin-related protein|nr:thioredoxin family protein [Planctomycetaceae bacterium]